MENDSPMYELPFTSEDWNSARQRFQSSLMVDTELAKLAQNIDANWPIRGKDETPDKYISFTLNELIEQPEFFEKTERVVLLYEIISETLAFDDPFSEMADYVDSSSKKDDSALKSLNKLEVPLTFPIDLTHLSSDTKDFCKNEGMNDLESLVNFSQNMAQSVVVGGEFRSFLNSLTHLDTETLKKFIPIRSGKSGLFLAESIGLLAADYSPAQAKYILSLSSLSYQRLEWKNAGSLSGYEEKALKASLAEFIQARVSYFPDQAQQLKHAFESGEQDFVRFFAPLADPDLESLAQAITISGLSLQRESKGFLKRLFSK